ncbi:MAG: hypothetical protein OXE17_01175 [Chloroflexi bacterium]|nr:hypothetical protein [Chloroflexota bacterium]
MLDESPLLGHLIPNLPVSNENAAVESLAYILNKSSASMTAFNAPVVETVGHPVAEVLKVETQASAADGSRPDLVGLDGAGDKRVIAEAKFWAALTDSQPNKYLSQLPDRGRAVLLLILPDVRIPASRGLSEFNPLIDCRWPRSVS